jgi:hypothetical protein
MRKRSLYNQLNSQFILVQINPCNDMCRKVVAALLLLNALIFAYAAYRSLPFLGDVTVPEGAIVYSVKGVLTGAWPLYRDYTVPPYGTTPYTPLFYLVSALLAGMTAKSVSAIYTCCRLLTLTSTFCSAFLAQRLFLCLKPSDYRMRYLALLLPFTILTLVAWGFAARPDMLAIMLSLAGVYVCVQSPASIVRLASGTAILALAWWCKPSFIAAPTAIFLSLVSERAWRRAAWVAFAYLVVTATLALATQYFFHGWFFTNIITANITTLRTDQVYWLTLYGYLYLAPFIVFAATLAYLIYGRDLAQDPKARCVTLYLAVSFTLNLAACMKEGAYFNYMLEPLFIACVIAPLGVQWLLKYSYTALATPSLLLASLLFSYHSYWYYDGAMANALGADITQENSQIQAVIDKMDSLAGDVLTSRSALAVRSIKPVLATDLFNTRYLEEKGKLSTQILAERIRRRELAAIVAPEGCQPSVSAASSCSAWPPLMRQAISESYAPGEILNHFVFWYPRPHNDFIPH